MTVNKISKIGVTIWVIALILSILSFSFGYYLYNSCSEKQDTLAKEKQETSNTLREGQTNISQTQNIINEFTKFLVEKENLPKGISDSIDIINKKITSIYGEIQQQNKANRTIKVEVENLEKEIVKLKNIYDKYVPKVLTISTDTITKNDIDNLRVELAIQKDIYRNSNRRNHKIKILPRRVISTDINKKLDWDINRAAYLNIDFKLTNCNKEVKKLYFILISVDREIPKVVSGIGETEIVTYGDMNFFPTYTYSSNDNGEVGLSVPIKVSSAGVYELLFIDSEGRVVAKYDHKLTFTNQHD